MPPTIEELFADNARLRAEIDKLQHWKALDKPLTAAMEIANSHVASMRAQRDAMLAALKACVKCAEDDEPLKESGWWSEEAINAIEAGRAAIKLAEGGG